jgi:hypothetical protein
MASTPTSAAQQQQAMVQQNAQARALILNSARLADQLIASVNNTAYPYTTGSALTLSIPIKPVGLIKRFLIDCTFNISQSTTETQIRTTYGPANVFSNITLNDLNNIQRVNTTSQHLTFVTSARRGFPLGSAITTDTPFGYGANNNVISAPSVIMGAQNMYVCFELPLAYSDTDLRGAIYANTVQSTMSLNLTLNPQFFVGNLGDATNAVYQSSTTALGKINSYTINVYQEYWDQLPMQNGQPILPVLDLGTMYQLISASYTGIVANTNYSIQFQAYRQYMSAYCVYDNGGVLYAGDDVNHWSLTSANALTNFQRDPQNIAFRSRLQFNEDQPKGAYYFDFRAAPVNTTAQGVTTLNLNANTVNSNAVIYAGFEFFALLNQLNMMGSIGSM